MRLGLCCTFLEEPLKFRAATARYVQSRPVEERGEYLGAIALDNARTLERAVEWCAEHGVGAFRVTSQLFPLATHPTAGYAFGDLPTGDQVRRALARARKKAIERDVRLSFHPDQFVSPGSESAHVVESSLRELEHQAEVAEAIGAEQLTLHGGGARPTKTAALERLQRGLDRLSDRARRRIVLENDDVVYTVEDLLPVCRALDVPLVYDVHHHRCNPDRLDVAQATELAAETWGEREPWFHLSSPRDGFRAGNPRSHADYIRPRDVPEAWLDRASSRPMTVDVEAKAKEQAVLRLQKALARKESGRRGGSGARARA